MGFLNIYLLIFYLVQFLFLIFSYFFDYKNIHKSLFHDEYQGYYKKKSDSIKLMKIMDNINKKFGDSKLRLSSDENGSFYQHSHLTTKNHKQLILCISKSKDETKF